MSSPASSPNPLSPSNLGVLPPIVTDATMKRSSSAKDRLSTYSNFSLAPQNRSRPGSHVFPVFHSSLTYALVRDFAYPHVHPLHYGPPPPASGVSTPTSEYRRLSDPPTSWDTSRGSWAGVPWGTENAPHHQRLPAMSFGDGPPYSEDEDLHSPVVTLMRQRKPTGTGSNGMTDNHMVDTRNADSGTFFGSNHDSREAYYVNGNDATENGPGGGYVTYPGNEGRHPYNSAQQCYESNTNSESEDENSGGDRYSHDYQFAVGCPDEEMHGKAVALFDFVREHENELPLTEGQVIYVSYRHGQGWLVAEDPKTGENGLVPEEFVRLLRDIEGGLNSLTGEPNADAIETSASIDMTEDERVSNPTPNIQNDANGDVAVTVSVEGSQGVSTSTGTGNRSSTMTKT